MHDEDRAFVKPPSVVPRTDVPVSTSPDDRGLEVRPFVAHDVLKGAVPGGLAMAWTHARPGTDVGLRSHPTPGLLIVLKGRALLTGGLRSPIEQGDVVMLPRDCQYGFVDVDSGGLHALFVAFETGGARDGEDVSTLAQLLERNERRAQQSLAGPYFQMLRSGALESNRSRERFRDAARVFSDAFQTILFTRQATCKDGEFAPIFLEHLREEIGHNELLTVSGARRAPEDPVLRATATWFCHQMAVLDNIEKAALVHLVLETAGYHFHTLAEPVLACDVAAEYFHVHAQADDDHKDVAVRLLENQHPATYRRLHRVIEEGWDMFGTMTERIVHLVEREPSVS